MENTHAHAHTHIQPPHALTPSMDKLLQGGVNPDENIWGDEPLPINKGPQWTSLCGHTDLSIRSQFSVHGTKLLTTDDSRKAPTGKTAKCKDSKDSKEQTKNTMKQTFRNKDPKMIATEINDCIQEN